VHLPPITGATPHGRRSGGRPRARRLATDPGGSGRPALGGVRAPRIPTSPLKGSHFFTRSGISSCEGFPGGRMMARDPLAGATYSRRDFLRGMSAAALAALAAGEPRLLGGAEPHRQPEPTADTLILIWLAGGMAAPETFDPKRYTP